MSNLATNPFGQMMSGQSQYGGHNDGPRGGFEKHTDKDVVVYCIFNGDKKHEVNEFVKNCVDCFAKSLSGT